MEKWSVDSCSHGRTTQNEYAGRKDFFSGRKAQVQKEHRKIEERSGKGMSPSALA